MAPLGVFAREEHYRLRLSPIIATVPVAYGSMRALSCRLPSWLRVSRRLNAIKTRRHKTRRAHSIDSIVYISLAKSFKCVTLALTSLATRKTTQWIEIAGQAIDLFNLDRLSAADNNHGSAGIMVGWAPAVAISGHQPLDQTSSALDTHTSTQLWMWC